MRSDSTPVNTSEEFVYKACKHSFLSPWSYLNPRGKELGKEFCDVLAVCQALARATGWGEHPIATGRLQRLFYGTWISNRKNS